MEQQILDFIHQVSKNMNANVAVRLHGNNFISQGCGNCRLLTVQWRPRGAAGQAGYGATAAPDASSSTQDAATSSYASSTCSSSQRSHPVQLLFDLLQAGTLLEARHPVDHPRGHVRAGAGCTAVGVDGKYMGGATEGADGHPATVLAETHVLDLDGDKTGSDVRGCTLGVKKM